MAQKIVFYPSTCSYMFALDSAYTPEKAAADLAAMNWSYNDGVVKFTLPANLLRCIISTINVAPGATEASGHGVAVLYTDDLYGVGEENEAEMIAAGYEVRKLESGGVEYSKTLTEAEQENLLAFQANFTLRDLVNGNGGILSLTGTAQAETEATEEPDPEEPEDTEKKEPQYIYPTGTISIKDLAVSNVGFKNHQDQDTYTHIRMLVAEIHDDTVGGEGHVWQSEPYEKDFDYLTVVDAIRIMCEGKELTHFNVSYILLKSSEVEKSGYEWVGEHIVGGATNVVTFSVTDEVKKSPINLEDTAYCLDPVLLTINRRDMPEIQNVTVEVQDYKADFEFYPDRKLLEIDIAEYLQTLFANVDIFEHQQLTTTVLVKLFDAAGELLEKQGITITAIYGKNPDPALPRCSVRVAWVDKYGVLHDELFKIVDNQTEGESKQKYVVSREEREDKVGEKSITLAKILANNAEREALKTIVFADHVRAWIGDTWKRVRIANTYKTGAGREKKNFEITIKYSL